MKSERMFTRVTQAALEEADDVLQKQAKEDAMFVGRRVRLVRAVVYEGVYEDVRLVIGKSLPVGVKRVPAGDEPWSGTSYKAHSITVVQGDYQLIEDGND